MSLIEAEVIRLRNENKEMRATLHHFLKLLKADQAGWREWRTLKKEIERLTAVPNPVTK